MTKPRRGRWGFLRERRRATRYEWLLGVILVVEVLAQSVALDEPTTLRWALSILAVFSVPLLLSDLRESAWGTAAAATLGLLAALLLSFPVAGAAQEFGQSDALLLGVLLPLLALPLLAGLAFSRYMEKRPLHLFAALIAMASGSFVYFALAPHACLESIHPQCVTFLGGQFVGERNDLVVALLGLVVAGAAFAVMWLLGRAVESRLS